MMCNFEESFVLCVSQSEIRFRQRETNLLEAMAPVVDRPTIAVLYVVLEWCICIIIAYG